MNVRKSTLILFAILYPVLGISAEQKNATLEPSQEHFENRRQFIESLAANLPSSQMAVESDKSQMQKSRGGAFLRSLILPGWGQHYAESRTMSRAFIASEVLLWAGYFGFSSWGNWLENDYKAFSARHAGVDMEGKDSRYFVNIGIYQDIYAYNEQRLRDRNLRAVYKDTEVFFWQWDTFDNRFEFDSMRIRSDKAKSRADGMIAAIIANHIVSAIHSTLAVYKFNKRLEEQQMGLRLDITPSPAGSQITLNLTKSF